MVELVNNPDALLSEAHDLVATADSLILDHCDRWVNLAQAVVSAGVPAARMVDVRDSSVV
jgi:hypothetical protein